MVYFCIRREENDIDFIIEHGSGETPHQARMILIADSIRLTVLQTQDYRHT